VALGFSKIDELAAGRIDFDFGQPASRLLRSRECLSGAASVNQLARPVWDGLR
jgi:hypothetical protein